MLQLIIGISLGLLLLFVLLLLITEVAATYPVWKQAGRESDSPMPPPPQSNGGRQGSFKLVLLILTGMVALGAVSYLLITALGRNVTAPELKVSEAAEPGRARKYLTGTVEGHQIRFQLQTKWEDGKIYGNSVFEPGSDTAWQFKESRFYFLDQEGFLLKLISFSPDDFVFITDANEKVTGLTHKFSTAMTLAEYEKVAKLQVVLDKKVEILTQTLTKNRPGKPTFFTSP